MGQQQFAFEDPGGSDPTKASGVPRRPAPRHRDALLALLDEVTRQVREAESCGGPGDPVDAEARTRLRHTVRNAQKIAGRARRAIEALPGTDLELLRAHGRLLAATREAHETRIAADFADGVRIRRSPAANGHPAGSLTRTGPAPGS